MSVCLRCSRSSGHAAWCPVRHGGPFIEVVEAGRPAAGPDASRAAAAFIALHQAFDEVGTCGLAGAFDLIEEGIPALAAEILRLRGELLDIRRIATRAIEGTP